MSDILSHIPLSGQYLYVESSEPRAVGDKAVLVSGVFKGLQCMRFMYHMHGQDIGSLSVYRFGDGIMKSLFWRRHGDQGDRWHEARITFPCNSTSYQVTMPYKVACRSTLLKMMSVRKNGPRDGDTRVSFARALFFLKYKILHSAFYVGYIQSCFKKLCHSDFRLHLILKFAI